MLVRRHVVTGPDGVDGQLAALARELRDCRGDAADELLVWSRIDALLDLRLAAGEPSASARG